MDQQLQPLSRVALAVSVAFTLACATGYKEQLTIETLASSRKPKRDLVEYLALTSAEPAACNGMRSDGPSVPFVNKGVVKAVNQAFDDQVIPIAGWEACTLHMWAAPDPIVRDVLEEALLGQLDALIRSPDLDSDSDLRARGYAMLRVLRDRDSDGALDRKAADRLLARSYNRREDAGAERASKLIDRLIGAIELERGLLDGRVLDSSDIAGESDPETLLLWARRLPDSKLSSQAGERLVRLRATESPFSFVRDDPDGAVRSLRDRGHVDVPHDRPVMSARWEPGPDDAVMLRLLQNYKKEWAKLLPSAADETRSPDGSVDLRGTLWATVEGVEEPVTLCPPADPWDPTPCLSPKGLKMSHAVATLGPTGRIRFDRDLDLDDVLRLGQDGDRLSAQIALREVAVTVDLPIFFDSVEEMVRVPSGGEGEGPDLVIILSELSNNRLLVEMPDAPWAKTWRALVPMSDDSFHVVSYGVTNSILEGKGGDIKVRMKCTNCDEVRAWAETHIRSEGGHGMPDGKVTIRKVREKKKQ